MSRENFRIMIVDDERSFLLLLKKILEDAGYTVKGLTGPEEAINLFDSYNPNLVITDLKMPGMDGIDLMGELKKKNSEIDFIMITAFATVETAVDAMKKGAADYITKPLREPEQLRISVARVYEQQRMLDENRLLKSRIFQDLPPVETIFAGMKKTYQEIMDVAETDATVLLYGETGTGKSLIAKIIHRLSGRSGPFVDINCAAIPENLLESELFGYEKGAFTGAVSQKKGRFELAHDGTVFLDEISEMSPALQAKMLRVLQERTFERLGSLNILKTNARIITATNRDLQGLVRAKKFREDLYYRVSVFPVTIPPLRERKENIGGIAEYLVDVMSARFGRGEKSLSEIDVGKLKEYPWPGNIRELENVLERSMILSKGSQLTLPDLIMPEDMGSQHEVGLRSIEMVAIENALGKADGSRKKAADMLGISLRSLQYKIKEYGIAGKRSS